MSFNGELFEIFSWFSVKDIYRFSSVCKSAKGLLVDDLFIKNQYENMQSVGDTSFIIQRKIYPWGSHASSSDSTEGCPIPYSSLDFLNNIHSVVASSNGLLLCKNIQDDENPLLLFNPATGDFLGIPLPDDFNIYKSEFIFECNANEISDDYLLLAIEFESILNPTYYSMLYSFKEHVWKDKLELNIGDSYILFKKSFYQNGTVYMISDYTAPYRCPYLVAYNIQNREERFLKVPKKARKEVGHSKRSTAGIFKNSSKSIGFVILIDNVFTVWFLIDQKKGLWKQVFKRRAKAMGLTETNLKVSHLTVQNGHILLITTEEKVYRYNLTIGDRTNTGSRVEEVFGQGCGEWDYFYSYTSSLRPCLPEATKLSAQILKEN